MQLNTSSLGNLQQSDSEGRISDIVARINRFGLGSAVAKEILGILGDGSDLGSVQNAERELMIAAMDIGNRTRQLLQL